MNDVLIDGHALIHGLDEVDIRYAWGNFAVRRMRRGGDVWVSIGFSARGVEIEMVVLELFDGSMLVIHALSPAMEKIKRELGLGRR